MATRIYRVEFNGKAHLVEAASKAKAANFVIAKHHSILSEVATSKMVAMMMAGGTAIEQAVEEPTTEAALEGIGGA